LLIKSTRTIKESLSNIAAAIHVWPPLLFQLIRGAEVNGFKCSINPISKKLVRACRHLRAMQKDPRCRAASGLPYNLMNQREKLLRQSGCESAGSPSALVSPIIVR
jgi:hypothetical protein